MQPDQCLSYAVVNDMQNPLVTGFPDAASFSSSPEWSTNEEQREQLDRLCLQGRPFVVIVQG